MKSQILVYRRVTKPALCCAVPAGAPLPPHVQGPGWEIVGEFDPTSAPAGYRDRQARFAFALQGFFVFTSLAAARTSGMRAHVNAASSNR
jgi:hypothetical protein